ncbi:MAG TPA: DNA-3-methyladenine glycosylase I [Candidatus Limnocylindrales bacterium]|nr:DNA-3-methyladenine glycosylase I [Candidatus Limnocylindrales bacterium]
MAAAFDPTLRRCWWAPGEPMARADPLMVTYHDEEWGRPLTDDRALFEKLSLDAFQAGLSWSIVLHKRQALRAAFAGFQPEIMADFGPDDVARMLADPGIIRNRAKIAAMIGNARRYLEVQAETGSFAAYLASFAEQPPRRLPPEATRADVPATSPASDALAADLRRRGWRFTGSTVVYAFMQAVGLVDDHLPTCYRYAGPG